MPPGTGNVAGSNWGGRLAALAATAMLTAAIFVLPAKAETDPKAVLATYADIAQANLEAAGVADRAEIVRGPAGASLDEPAPSLAAVSMATTALLPSIAVRIPGYLAATVSDAGRLRANSFIHGSVRRRVTRAAA